MVYIRGFKTILNCSVERIEYYFLSYFKLRLTLKIITNEG